MILSILKFHSRIFLRRNLALVALLVCMGGTGEAAPVLNVDLGPSNAPAYTGTGSIASGTYWELKDTRNAGIVTGLKYSDGTTVSPFSIEGKAGGTEGEFDLANQLLTGGISIHSGYNATGSFTIFGADPTKSYDLVLYAFNSENSPTYFTLNGTVKTASSSQGTSFADGVNCVTYSGVTPTPDSENLGTIQFTFDYQEANHNLGTTNPDLGEASKLISFSGFQLTEVVAVQEPGTKGLSKKQATK